MTTTQKPAAAPVTELRPGQVYLAPSGRCCMLMGREKQEGPGAPTYATLVYHREDGRPGAASDEAFTLMPANFRLLRRLG